MCYNLHTNLKSQLKRAIHKNAIEDIKDLKKEISKYEDFYYVSAFSHPNLLVYTNKSPKVPLVQKWGLIPHWTKSKDAALKLWNNTPNCRAESMFEKASFKDSSLTKRCILPVEGFYEYHHKNGKSFPYYIRMKDKSTFNLGGLWSEWLNSETGEIIESFTIVTTKANKMLKKIHNNPKLKEARMPLIIDDNKVDEWLNTDLAQEDVERLISSYEDDKMESYTVGKLQGKGSKGNKKEVLEPVNYAELNLLTLDL